MNKIQNISRVLLCLALFASITAQGAAALAAAPAGGFNPRNPKHFAYAPITKEIFCSSQQSFDKPEQIPLLSHICKGLEGGVITFQEGQEFWQRDFPNAIPLIHRIIQLASLPMLRFALRQGITKEELTRRTKASNGLSVIQYIIGISRIPMPDAQTTLDMQKITDHMLITLNKFGVTPDGEDIKFMNTYTGEMNIAAVGGIDITTFVDNEDIQHILVAAKTLLNKTTNTISPPKISYPKTAAKQKLQARRAAAEAAAQVKEAIDAQALADEETQQRTQAQHAKQQARKEAAAQELQAKLAAEQEEKRRNDRKAQKRAEQAAQKRAEKLLAAQEPNLDHFFGLYDQEIEEAQEAARIKREKQERIDAQKERNRIRKAEKTAAIIAALPGLGGLAPTIIDRAPQSFAPAGLVTPGPEERAKRVQEVDHSDVEVNPEAMRMHDRFEKARAQYLQQALHRPALTK
jgi:hypothetical protein